MKATNQLIKAFVQSHSYLVKMNITPDTLDFATRWGCWNGKVADEDIEHTVEVKKQLLAQFDNICVTLDGSDEWASLYVEIL